MAAIPGSGVNLWDLNPGVAGVERAAQAPGSIAGVARGVGLPVFLVRVPPQTRRTLYFKFKPLICYHDEPFKCNLQVFFWL